MEYLIQTPGQLSSQLRALRKARGLSQMQLGAMLGVGQTRIARIEHDPTAISVEQFLSILSALGVQMLLRPTGADAAASSAAARKRRPTEEPW